MSPTPPRIAWSIALLWLAGCASPLPQPLREEPPHAPGFRAVQSDPQTYRGVAVRWGGVIIRVDNGPSGSEMEVLARPLDGAGRPLPEGPALGRFIARIEGFLDPLVYKADSEVTLGGKLADPAIRRIGTYPYSFPVVEIQALHLWAPRPIYRDPPYWYDPWYPWGYPYPWWKNPYYPYW